MDTIWVEKQNKLVGCSPFHNGSCIKVTSPLYPIVIFPVTNSIEDKIIMKKKLWVVFFKDGQTMGVVNLLDGKKIPKLIISGFDYFYPDLTCQADFDVAAGQWINSFWWWQERTCSLGSGFRECCLTIKKICGAVQTWQNEKKTWGFLWQNS